MKKTILFFTVILFLSACNVSTTPENNGVVQLDSIKIGRETKMEAQQFKGLYRSHQSNFIDCISGQLFVLKNTSVVDSLYNLILPNAYTDEAIYVEMNATTDINDSGALTYTDGIKAEQKNYKNNCITSDYWCTGFEPFWVIQISKNEDLIDFYNPMEQKTTHFVYAAPEIKNGVTIYSSTDGENKITISIKEEKCNGAIDKQYDFSAKVQLNNKKYTGCGLQTEVVKASQAINK